MGPEHIHTFRCLWGYWPIVILLIVCMAIYAFGSLAVDMWKFVKTAKAEKEKERKGYNKINPC